MSLIPCTLPLPCVASTLVLASNQEWGFQMDTVNLIGHGNVRVMRPTLDNNNACFALSGKLADVCAALDAMAQKEQLQAMRCAMQ